MIHVFRVRYTYCGARIQGMVKCIQVLYMHSGCGMCICIQDMVQHSGYYICIQDNYVVHVFKV